MTGVQTCALPIWSGNRPGPAVFPGRPRPNLPLGHPREGGPGLCARAPSANAFRACPRLRCGRQRPGHTGPERPQLPGGHHEPPRPRVLHEAIERAQGLRLRLVGLPPPPPIDQSWGMLSINQPCLTEIRFWVLCAVICRPQQYLLEHFLNREISVMDHFWFKHFPKHPFIH